MRKILIIGFLLSLVVLIVASGSKAEKKSDPLPEVQIETQAEAPQPTGRIMHSGFSPDDPRQRMVAEAYDL